MGTDLDLVVRHVGHGIDGQSLETEPANDDQRQRKQENQPTVVNGKADEFLDHRNLLMGMGVATAPKSVQVGDTQQAHTFDDNLIPIPEGHFRGEHHLITAGLGVSFD
jgi:hypothetical protein